MMRIGRTKTEKILLFITIVLGVILIGTIVFSLFFFNREIKDTESLLRKKSYKEYSKYFVMIADDMDTEFWQSIYESAKAEAEENQAYIELLGDSLDDNYTKQDLIKIAVNIGADGIIVEGDDSLETIAAINEAEDKGIPVVTLGEDCGKSGRQSFVGISGYNLGREYGSSICDYVRNNELNECNVMILLDAAQSVSNQTIITTALQGKIEEEGLSENIRIESVPISNQSDFEAEEQIRDLFLGKKELPDIMVTLSETNTICAYQAVVDYNHVGEVEIMGYYLSQTIKKALSKGVISSTITVDTTQMGTKAVKALCEYIQSGYVSTMYLIDLETITGEDVEADDGKGGGHE